MSPDLAGKGSVVVSALEGICSCTVYESARVCPHLLAGANLPEVGAILHLEELPDVVKVARPPRKGPAPEVEPLVSIGAATKELDALTTAIKTAQPRQKLGPLGLEVKRTLQGMVATLPSITEGVAAAELPALKAALQRMKDAEQKFAVTEVQQGKKQTRNAGRRVEKPLFPSRSRRSKGTFAAGDGSGEEQEDGEVAEFTRVKSSGRPKIGARGSERRGYLAAAGGEGGG